jgi:pimeloyl-ACP methyl ester carboxylesterase
VTEATRARYPDAEGYVGRDGERAFYEVFGEGEPAIFFLPAWAITHSRLWKGQVPYFARHTRVLTLDPRGNGRSDRPTDPAAYGDGETLADIIGVMDATETERAIVIGLSDGGWFASLLAARHPERGKSQHGGAPRCASGRWPCTAGSRLRSSSFTATATSAIRTPAGSRWPLPRAGAWSASQGAAMCRWGATR